MVFPLGTGLSALSAARFAIQTIGNNLANAATPGYSRERVLFGTTATEIYGGRRIGGGVRVESLQRVSDDLLSRRVRVQQHEVSRRNVVFQHLQSVELALGGLDEHGISTQITQYFNGLSQLATSPDDGALRNGTVQNALTLAELIRGAHSDIGATQEDVDLQIDYSVSEVNRIATSLAAINQDLTSAQGRTSPPPELLDAQERLLAELSDYVDIQVQDVGAGRKNVTIGGQMIVSYGTQTDAEIRDLSGGGRDLFVVGGSNPVDVRGGRLRGLLELGTSTIDRRRGELDTFARGLILAVNRVHSTGVPPSGGYSRLDASNRVTDSNGNGFLDEPLSAAGLPFDLVNGRLHVNVLDPATGAAEHTAVTINAATDTVGDLVGSLNAVSGITAAVDSTGRLSISAQPGKQFHFASAVDPNPDDAGAFGSAHASITGTAQEPFALAPGDQLAIAIDGGAPTTITFTAGQFADINNATAAEIAAAINGTLTGGTARAVDGRVVIESSSTGAGSQVRLNDASGSPAVAIGLSTAPDFGGEYSVNVTAGGAYTGAADETYTFRPLGDGTVGVTPGLQLEVRDSAGLVVATLDVGAGYSPGEQLDVASGVTVGLDAGDISGTSGDVFSVDLFADGDSSDVLAAFGLNAFFTGTDASDIDVDARLVADPALLAQGLGTGVADNRNLLRLVDLRDFDVAELDDKSIEGYFGVFVADVGLETSRAGLAAESETLLLESFENRLEQVRGVSIDEELADLQRFEQAYQAAARYVSAVNEVTQVLFNI